ncbi:CLUMA_CG003174, isoform A [Clunio marinus]|uniref:CLUMA_CG003174, isoform A n=1 Tax=Clunio marinus TaxID=568069 RepID=A0A1J1HTA7_9DIPT|nr:CLUMA_CG003174, isoform A [Clunio marinus]
MGSYNEDINKMSKFTQLNFNLKSKKSVRVKVFVGGMRDERELKLSYDNGFITCTEIISTHFFFFFEVTVKCGLSVLDNEMCISWGNGHFMYHRGWKRIYGSMNDNSLRLRFAHIAVSKLLSTLMLTYERPLRSHINGIFWSQTENGDNIFTLQVLSLNKISKAEEKAESRKQCSQYLRNPTDLYSLISEITKSPKTLHRTLSTLVLFNDFEQCENL